MLPGQRIGGGRQDLVMISIQLVPTLQHNVCRPVQVRPGDEECQTLEHVARPLGVVERLILGFYVVEIRQPLQIRAEMAGRQRTFKAPQTRGLSLISATCPSAGSKPRISASNGP